MSVSFDRSSLFNRLLERELSPAEAEELVKWLGNQELDPAAAELFLSQLKQPVKEEEISPGTRMTLDSKLPIILATKNSPAFQIPFLRSRWVRYAAAVIILISVGALFVVNRSSKETSVPETAVSKKDVLPGKEGAILTLDDGRTVVLDDMGNGVVADQNGTKAVLKNGQLVYEKKGSHAATPSYNTMTTPRGRQFHLVLPDGSKVWMNAASSLRYPTVFTGNERKVEITGEMYFEVAKNAKMPFKVQVNDETEIEVTGTHFNVNSYKNEVSINTSLLEGSVKINHGKEGVILKPGQQAQVDNKSGQLPVKVIQDVDMEKVMAWKNGVFNFEDASLEEVMRQLERWYDIEVVYEKAVPQLEFVGKMGRDLRLSEVLRGLEMSEVHFSIEEGKRLIVKP